MWTEAVMDYMGYILKLPSLQEMLRFLVFRFSSSEVHNFLATIQSLKNKTFEYKEMKKANYLFSLKRSIT